MTKTATAILFVAATTFAGDAAAQERTLRAEELAEGVHLITSSNIAEPNLLAVVGGDRVLLVDGSAPDAVDELHRILGNVTGSPVRDLVLTHWHPDHSMGNAAFRARGATVWAHANAQRRMQSGNAIEHFGLDIPAYPVEALADSTLVAPRTLWVGQTEVRIIPRSAAHTDGDMLVFLPRANVLHMGDIAMGGIYPFIELSSGGDVEGMLAAMDQALELSNDQTRIVPGHGPLLQREDLAGYRAMLATVWDRVRTAVAEGRSVAEVTAAEPAREYDSRWSTPVLTTEQFVRILYQAAAAQKKEA